MASSGGAMRTGPARRVDADCAQRGRARCGFATSLWGSMRILAGLRGLASAWKAAVDWTVRGVLAVLLIGIAYRIGLSSLLK